MTFIPLMVRAAEQFRMEKVALVMAWPGYLWMGFLLIFTSALLFTDALRHLYLLTTRLVLQHPQELISPRHVCMSALLLAFVASIYAIFEADQIRSQHVTIASTKLPATISRIRLVQVSDVHIGLLLQKHRLQRILDKIREAGPDLLISTGDLVDGKLNRADGMSELNPVAALLAAVPAPSGKYAIIGNHEVYAGLPQALAFTRAAGFTILRNQSVTLKSGITISGIDDRAVNPKALADSATETALINSVPHDSFHLLLKHRPEIPPESDGRFDLLLSGHVHGGQIFPFNLLVKLEYPIPCGITTTQAGSHIYISRGTGTWGPPMRLLAPPEITIIDIVRR
ncbi:MAG TPA: metallophosphoesterase [Dongiaceae bacterium]|nr:metallophosphoesterase [Dongiaceae bacterium]